MNEIEKDKANTDKIKVLEEMVHEKDNQIFQLKTILDQVPGNIYWKNKEGVYLGLNAKGMESLRKKGFIAKESEIIGKTDEDVYLKETAHEFRKNDMQVIQTAKEMVTEESTLLPSGEKIIQLSTKRPLLDQAGQIIGIIGNTVDITSLKKIEADLRISNKIDVRQTEFFYNNILSKLPTNVYWKDKDSIYRGCNDRIANALGLSSRGDINGKTDFDFNWGREGAAESFIEFDKKVMHTQQSLTTEDVFKEANGQFVTVLTTKTPLKDEKNQVIGVLAISVDITEKKKAEQELKEAKEKAERLSQAKSEFIANMSHDVKTPLAGMIGLAEVLQKFFPKTGQPKDFIQGILDSGHQLMHFFDNCLEMAKSDDVNIVLTKERFSLIQLLNEIETLFYPSIQHKNLNLHLAYDEKLPPTVIGSRPALYRILLNLLGNAVKFTSQGHITLHATLSPKSTSRHIIVKLIVADTGVGIPLEKQSTIFEKFTRLTPSYQGIYEGSGIGLFVVQKLVTAMGGEIYVKSKEGEGSQFIVAVPLDVPLLEVNEYEESTLQAIQDEIIPSLSSIPLQAKSITTEKKTTLEHYKVLLVEDSLIAQQVGKSLLSELGCDVDIAACGEQALELFKPGKYHFIYMDIGLPDMSGDQVAQRLREKERGHLPPVPIFALTAHPVSKVISDCQRSGMQGVLTKPLSSLQASQIIQHYLQGQPIEVEGLQAFKENIAVSQTLGLGMDLPETEAGLFQLDHYPLIDVSKGLETIQDKAVLQEMLNLFAKDILPKEIATLEQCYKEKDWESIQSTAHKLKGSSLYIGATQMLYACQYLERYYKAGHHSLLENLYKQCLNVLEQTKQYIEKLSI